MTIQLKPWLSKILFAVASLALLIQLGSALFEYARYARAALTFPFPLDYGEGPLLDQTLRLARYEAIYRNDFSTPPYTISNYPPLFPLIQVPFAWVFGPAFWYGRAISLLGATSAALFIGLTLYTLTGDRIAAGVGGLTLLAFPYILHWSAFNRVDSLALGLSWAGLFAVVRWPERQKGLLLAGFCFTAAIYTRQTYAMAAPLAAIAWLAQIKQGRRALQLAGLVGGICLGLFCLLNLSTRGGFYANLVTANLNPLTWGTATTRLIDIPARTSSLMLGSLTFVIAERTRDRTRSWRLVAPYLLTAFVSAFTTMAKNGAWVNYLFEPAAALCLATGAIIAWTGKTYWAKAAVVFLLAIQVNSLVGASRGQYIPLVMGKVAAVSEVSQMAQLVRDTPGSVLADEYMGLIPLAGRRLYFQPFEFTQLQKTGNWDQAAVLASIRRQEFSAILLYEPANDPALMPARWTPEMRAAVESCYVLKTKLASTCIYVPKK
jgi:hypothetical protein